MLEPGVSRIISKFNNHSDKLATFVVFIYMLGYTLGPLLLRHPANSMDDCTLQIEMSCSVLALHCVMKFVCSWPFVS